MKKWSILILVVASLLVACKVTPSSAPSGDKKVSVTAEVSSAVELSEGLNLSSEVASSSVVNGSSQIEPSSSSVEILDSSIYVSGKVVVEGLGLEGVIVSLGSETTTTDSFGEFEIELSLGSGGVLTFEKTGFEFSDAPVFEDLQSSPASLTINSAKKYLQVAVVVQGRGVVSPFGYQTVQYDSTLQVLASPSANFEHWVLDGDTLSSTALSQSFVITKSTQIIAVFKP